MSAYCVCGIPTEIFSSSFHPILKWMHTQLQAKESFLSKKESLNTWIGGIQLKSKTKGPESKV